MNTMMQLQLLLGTGSAAEGGKSRPTADAATGSFRDVLVHQKGGQAPLQGMPGVQDMPDMQALAQTLETTDRQALDELFVQLDGNPVDGAEDIMARLASDIAVDNPGQEQLNDLQLLTSLRNQMAWQDAFRQPQPDNKTVTVEQDTLPASTALLDNEPRTDMESATFQAAELAGLHMTPGTQQATDPARVSAAAETMRPVMRTAEALSPHQLSSAASTLDGDLSDLPIDSRQPDNRAAPEWRFQPVLAQQPEPVTGRTGLQSGTGLPEEGLTGVNASGFQSASTGDTATLSAARQDPAQAALQARLGTPQWGTELGRQMATMVRRGDQQVSLHLNPQELGPLSVDIRVHEQQAQLQIVSSHAQVRSAVEQALPQLREALAEQGINLGETSVSDQRPQSREGDSGNRQASTEADENLQPAPAGADTDTVTAVTEGGSGINLYV